MELARRGTGTPQHELAEQVFGALVGDTAVGFAVLDAELRYLTVNERLARIDGVPVEEHLGRRLADVLPHFAPVAEAPFREVLRTGPPRVRPAVLGVRAGHRRRPAALARERLPRPGPPTGPSPAWPCSCGRSPTGWRPEQRRDQMLALLDVLIGQAPIGIAFLDRELRYVRINEVLAAANGRSVAEHLGQAAARGDPRDRRRHRGGGWDGSRIDSELETAPLWDDPHRRRHWKVSFYPVYESGPGGPPTGSASS